MKTLKQVNQDIQSAVNEANFIKQTKEKTGLKAVLDKIKSMRLARNYIELNPTEGSVINQSEYVKKCLGFYERDFKAFKEINKNIAVTRQMFHVAKDIDLKDIKRWKSELKFLNYLLS